MIIILSDSVPYWFINFTEPDSNVKIPLYPFVVPFIINSPFVPKDGDVWLIATRVDASIWSIVWDEPLTSPSGNVVSDEYNSTPAWKCAMQCLKKVIHIQHPHHHLNQAMRKHQ